MATSKSLSGFPNTPEETRGLIPALVLYNLVLMLGLFFLWPVGLFFLATVPKMRAGFFQKLGDYPEDFLSKVRACQAQHSNDLIWFHAVSVGEFNALWPLIEKTRAAGHGVVISTTTATGQALARQKVQALAQQKCPDDIPVFYFPFDLRATVAHALETIQPRVVVLMETELWPNLIDSVARHPQAKLLLINGRISPRSYRGYRRIRAFLTPFLAQFSHCYMQSEGDRTRMLDLGAPPERVSVAGNLKFDALPLANPAQQQILQTSFGFSAETPVLTVASTHEGEEWLFASLLPQLQTEIPGLKLILAPRHPERVGEVTAMLDRMGLSFTQRSMLSPQTPNKAPIIILDTIGELVAVYGLSTVAVIGGSFVPTGGHNPLEALAQGTPVIFGPHMVNFPEIARLIVEAEAGLQLENDTQVLPALQTLFNQPETRQAMARQGQALLAEHRGVTDMLFQALQSLTLNRVNHPKHQHSD